MNDYFNSLEQNLGRTIQRIRRSKNFTQKDIAGQSMDQSTVGRIENSKVLPSYLHFMEMAYNLGLTVNELIFYTSGNTLSQRDQVIMLINRFNNSADLKFLEQVRHLCRKYYKETGEQFFVAILDCTEMYLRYQDLLKVNMEDFIHPKLAKIWERIMSASEWHVSEWAMVSIIMSILPTHLAILAGEEILSQMHEFDFLTYEMIDIRQQIMSNMGHIYLGKKDIKNAKGYLQTLLSEESELCGYRLGNTYLAIGMCYWAEGDVEAFENNFFKGVLILKFAKYDQYLQRRLQALRRNYSDADEALTRIYNQVCALARFM